MSSIRRYTWEEKPQTRPSKYNFWDVIGDPSSIWKWQCIRKWFETKKLNLKTSQWVRHWLKFYQDQGTYFVYLSTIYGPKIREKKCAFWLSSTSILFLICLYRSTYYFQKTAHFHSLIWVNKMQLWKQRPSFLYLLIC